MKQQDNIGSARNITRYITHGRITRIIVIFVTAISDAPIAVINHVALVCDDHHCIIL